LKKQLVNKLASQQQKALKWAAQKENTGKPKVIGLQVKLANLNRIFCDCAQVLDEQYMGCQVVGFALRNKR